MNYIQTIENTKLSFGIFAAYRSNQEYTAYSSIPPQNLRTSPAAHNTKHRLCDIRNSSNTIRIKIDKTDNISVFGESFAWEFRIERVAIN